VAPATESRRPHHPSPGPAPRAPAQRTQDQEDPDAPASASAEGFEGHWSRSPQRHPASARSRRRSTSSTRGASAPRAPTAGQPKPPGLGLRARGARGWPAGSSTRHASPRPSEPALLGRLASRVTGYQRLRPTAVGGRQRPPRREPPTAFRRASTGAVLGRRTADSARADPAAPRDPPGPQGKARPTGAPADPAPRGEASRQGMSSRAERSASSEAPSSTRTYRSSGTGTGGRLSV
jgi:hypothetical protein